MITINSLWSDDTKAAGDLAERIIPKLADNFIFESIAQEKDRDVFEIESLNDKIVIRGSSAIAMAGGLNWYIKHHKKGSVSWCGDNLPIEISPVAEKIRQRTPYKYGFYLNYCTFSYSMAWWDWARWEREIDYMAMCGINMPLAITGCEAVWLNFLKRFGYTEKEAKNFISGPGYTAWWLMGNLEGRGGPLTDKWIAERVELQKKILKRMKELGMLPAVPGFVGLVPTDFAEKNPGTKTLPQGRWAGPNTRPHVLHPDDPLFDKAAEAWYEEWEKIYGKADCFAGDLFHEGGKTHDLDIAGIARKVQGFMLKHNPASIWVIQGWGRNPKKELLTALKKENTLVVDLCNEFWTHFKKNEGFFGYPWCFSTIIMYGGNVGLHGRLADIAKNLNDALESKNPPCGLGATWESIEVNPVVMDFLWDMRWREKCPDLNKWISEYAVRRYGSDKQEVKDAWRKLLRSGYGAHPGLRRPTESILCARPSLAVKKVSAFASTIEIQYDHRDIRDAVKLLLSAEDECRDKKTYQFDLVDTTRQFLTNTAQIAYREMVEYYKQKNLENFKTASDDFLAILDDQDRLLGTEPLYMLGKWLHDARLIATTDEQADQNEQNARLLVSVWNKEKSVLRDYAWKEWNGMLKNYYKPRWEMFITQCKKELKAGTKNKPIDFYPFEHKWACRNFKDDPYPYTAQEDPVKTSEEIFNKWQPWFEKHYKPENIQIFKEESLPEAKRVESEINTEAEEIAE